MSTKVSIPTVALGTTVGQKTEKQATAFDGIRATFASRKEHNHTAAIALYLANPLDPQAMYYLGRANALTNCVALLDASVNSPTSDVQRVFDALGDLRLVQSKAVSDDALQAKLDGERSAYREVAKALLNTEALWR